MQSNILLLSRALAAGTGGKLMRGFGLVLLMLFVALPSQAQSTKKPQESVFADPIVGKWVWFTGTIVTLNADGTLRDNNGARGKWVCSDKPNKLYIIHWGRGKWQDTVKLVNGDKKLVGKNQDHVEVSATRAKGG